MKVNVVSLTALTQDGSSAKVETSLEETGGLDVVGVLTGNLRDKLVRSHTVQRGDLCASLVCWKPFDSQKELRNGRQQFSSDPNLFSCRARPWLGPPWDCRVRVGNSAVLHRQAAEFTGLTISAITLEARSTSSFADWPSAVKRTRRELPASKTSASSKRDTTGGPAALGQYLAQASTTFPQTQCRALSGLAVACMASLAMPALILNRSSRVWPGFLQTCAGMALPSHPLPPPCNGSVREDVCASFNNLFRAGVLPKTKRPPTASACH